jgi:hypothetical protein
MSRMARPFGLRPYRSISAIVLVAMSAAGIAAVTSARAHIHHSPDGTSVNWYPGDCCHEHDCHPVSRIHTLSDGFLMTTEEGTTLFVDAMRWRRPSQDSRWHICFGAGREPVVHCVFAPPNA